MRISFCLIWMRFSRNLMGKLHVDEVLSSVLLVDQLIQTQFPQWAHLPVRAFDSAGTDNTIYRLGDELVVRLPRVASVEAQIDRDYKWMPRFAPHLPVAIPEPLVVGEPVEPFPFRWSVNRWLAGENVVFADIVDPNRTAAELTSFILALRGIDTESAPTDHYRGQPLALRDQVTRHAIESLRDMFDSELLTKIWDEAVALPPYDGDPMWFHGDLLPGNLLFVDGRLSAVIDFGTMSVGDPTVDLMVAWSLLEGESRQMFRSAMRVDEVTWLRGRGWALSIALVFIPYYLNTNPVGVASAKGIVEQILAENG